MGTSYSFSLATAGGSRLSLNRRQYDGVETDRSTVETFDIDEARSLLASLEDAIKQAGTNAAVLLAKRRKELTAKRLDLERQIHDIDAEIAKDRGNASDGAGAAT